MINKSSNTNQSSNINQSSNLNQTSSSNNSIDKYLSDEYINAASTTDCTGLIPSKPESKEELESYKEVYNYEVPIAEVNKKTK